MTPHPSAVLAVADGTPASTNAAWRAALVARDLRAPLRLLQAGPRADALGRSAAAGARRMADDIAGRLRIEVHTQRVEGDVLRAIVAAAPQAQLLVIGTRRANPLRELVFGTQAERLIRLCRLPVLVVKRPANGSYRRVLVPVDLAGGAQEVVAAAARLSRDPAMEVLHALDRRDSVSLRVGDVPEALLRELRDRSLVRAHTALDAVLLRAGFAGRVRPVITFGDPAATVLARAQAARTELVVIGKRTRGLLADFFLGGVTQRVLAGARADVLVLPRGAHARAGDPGAGVQLRLS